MRFFLMLTALLVMMSPSFAAERAKTGEIIPHALNLTDQNSVDQSFESVIGDKGATLVFFRSVDWCPYCQVQLTKLSDETEKLSALGYPLVGISYDSVEKLQAFETKLQQRTNVDQSGLVLLSDAKSEAITAFGLLNTENKEGSFAYGVPYPAIYIVNKDKTIKTVLAEEGYKDRPEIEAILEAAAK